MQKPWRLQDAKAKFSQVVEAAMQGEPQHVTRSGREAVVVLSEKTYRALRTGARRGKSGFVEHLLAIPKVEEQSRGRRIKLRDVEL